MHTMHFPSHQALALPARGRSQSRRVKKSTGCVSDDGEEIKSFYFVAAWERQGRRVGIASNLAA